MMMLKELVKKRQRFVWPVWRTTFKFAELHSRFYSDESNVFWGYAL